MQATQKQVLVSVSGIPGYWNESSGADVTAAVTKIFEGGNERPVVLGGVPETSDIEVIRPYHPDTHGTILAKLKKEVGRGRFTVTKQPTDANKVKVGKPETHPSCLLIGATSTEHKEGSGDAQTWKLTFSTSGAA